MNWHLVNAALAVRAADDALWRNAYATSQLIGRARDALICRALSKSEYIEYLILAETLERREHPLAIDVGRVCC